MQVHAYAAFEKGGEMKPHTYEQGPLPEDYVDVKVTHCGICFTDIAMVNGELGFEQFPLVPGHEASGVVHAIGKAVTNVKVGDRVGCHNIRSCCNGCQNCNRGYTEMCTRHDWLVSGKGGFGEYVRMQAPFLYVLPEGLSNENAASLMCAGSTIWASLREPGVRAGDRVAILGIGGLGHLGLKFARAFGCEVAAISTSRSKEADAKKLGAHHFIVSSDPEDIKKYQDYFDLIVVTATAPIDFKPLCAMLRDKGTITLPGTVGEELKLPTFPIMLKGLRVMGICGCGHKEQTEMIEFCAKNKIFPDIEPLPFSKINEGFERVKKGTPRYRVVLHQENK